MCDESECCGCFGRYKNFALGFFVGLAIVAAAVVLVLAYARASHPRFAVEDASLTRFALSGAGGGASSLSYNLTLSLTVRNPNWAMSVAYRSLDADYLFHGQRFDSVAVVAPAGSSSSSSDYVQPARKTAVFHLATGADAAALGSAGAREFRRESGEGVFDVEVALSGEVRYQLHRTWCRLEARCPLKLQLAAAPDAGGGAVVFQETTCDVLRSSQRGC